MTNASRGRRRRAKAGPAPAEPPAPRPAPAHGAHRVLVTGASGFVGRNVVAALRAGGWQVVALARHIDAATARSGIIQVAADIASDSWLRWCEGCSAVVHLVGIIREKPRQRVTFDRVHRLGTERVIAACQQLGIRRLIHMSALGARQRATTAYHRSKWLGEEAVRASGLTWTIFRPSVIFGPGDGFSTALARVVAATPAFPVFGDGTIKMQPISVGEVAEAFVASLELAESFGRTVELGGPETLSYDEVVRRTARALGRRARLFHLPVGLSRALVAAASRLPNAPITPDELTMLLEGSTGDTSVARVLFGVPTTRYEGPTWLRRDPASAPPQAASRE